MVIILKNVNDKNIIIYFFSLKLIEIEFINELRIKKNVTCGGAI